MISIEDLSCKALRAEPAPWPEAAHPDFGAQFLEGTAYHGVQGLLHHQIRSAPGWNGWPADLCEGLARETRRETALELVRKPKLVRVLDALAERGVHPLLMKGTPLAYTHYPSPSLRQRGDTDMLIRKPDLETTRQVLAELGYEHQNAVSGELVSYQFTTIKRDVHGVPHALDVHWKITNCQALAEALTYQELAFQSVPVPPLGRQARALGSVHALLLACMHRVAHVHSPYFFRNVPHFSGNRLIWLYDIHLLAGRMSQEELEHTARLAAQKQVRAICQDGLLFAQQCFGTRLPEDFMEALSPQGVAEPSTVYLSPRRLKCLWGDITSLSGWKKRLQLLEEHTFPPADYVLRKYGVSSRAWLPILYLRRAIPGAWKLLRGH